MKKVFWDWNVIIKKNILMLVLFLNLTNIVTKYEGLSVYAGLSHGYE